MFKGWTLMLLLIRSQEFSDILTVSSYRPHSGDEFPFSPASISAA